MKYSCTAVRFSDSPFISLQVIMAQSDEGPDQGPVRVTPEEGDEGELHPPLIRNEGLLAELRCVLPPVRLGSDDEYRLDSEDMDARTRAEFIQRYGFGIGEEKWRKAGEKQPTGESDDGPVEELNPRDGDIIRFQTKGTLSAEGIVLKRAGMRLRVGLLDEKTSWIACRAVLDILAKHTAKCMHYRINVRAVEFGRCVCGLLRAQHDPAAILPDRPVISYGEGLGAAEVAAVELRDHRLPRGMIISEEPSEEPGEDDAADEPRTSHVLEEEYRIDPEDQYAYNHDDFVAKYGGEEEWECAEIVRESQVD